MEIQDETGSRRNITKLVSPLLSSDGEVTGCIEILQDLSAYNELLDRIRYDEHRLKLILDNLDIGVFTVNRGGHITSFNSMAESITGYERQEILGQHHAKLTGCNLPGQVCSLAESIETGETLANLHRRLFTKDGRKLPIRANFMALRNEAGQTIGGLETFQDLSLIQKLNRAISDKYTFADMIGKDGVMQQVFEILPVVAESEANVLVEGPTGTGKDLLAKIIHNASRRKDKPFVKVNCAALPDNLLESEMFGYVKGAFTGADRDKPGRFQEAEGGSIFLDEIGDLPLSLQAKLLRVLEDKEFYPLGGRELSQVDVRIIAATNQILENLVREKKFREDLYYRLNVMRLELPPLKERRADIPLLINNFVKQYNVTKGASVTRIAEDAMDILLNYDYPGNIRELENIIEHACVLCQGEIVERRHLPLYMQAIQSSRDEGFVARPGVTEARVQRERELIVEALEEHRWHRQKAAKALGMDRTTLWRKMKKYNIAR
ncbi:MAG: sigma 54-interacting transcriptional regulator [Deltaproteobacteria bacterium]|nr:MAG: sigma 54-interacting transcriptional regulator [Deltaproteobacteria bacterium]